MFCRPSRVRLQVQRHAQRSDRSKSKSSATASGRISPREEHAHAGRSTQTLNAQPTVEKKSTLHRGAVTNFMHHIDVELDQRIGVRGLFTARKISRRKTDRLPISASMESENSTATSVARSIVATASMKASAINMQMSSAHITASEMAT